MRNALWHDKKLQFSFTFFLIAAWLLLTCISAQAETPDEITSDPHYHLLLQNDQVRVFEVALRPTEHAFVRHPYNFLVVTLQDCDMVMWNEGESEILNFHFNQGDARFFYSGPARGLRNDRTTDYHNITVEFLNPKVTTFGYQPTAGKWDYGSNALNPPVDPSKKFKSTLQLGEAAVSDVQLLQGDALLPPDKGSSELVIPVTDLDVKVEGDRHVRKSPGSIWWAGNERKTDLTNGVPEPTKFVVVELKASHN